MSDTKRLVYWAGTPTKCDLCGARITESFVDGRTKPMGQWAIMDLGCHAKRGYSLGQGYGQLYEKQEDGRWLKTEG